METNMANAIENIKEEKNSQPKDNHQKINQEMVMDVPVEISIEIARVEMLLKDVLNLETGSIININKSPQDPVEIYVNGKAVGKGEIVMLDEFVGVRIIELGG